jgi:hypothetical protein
MTDKPVPPYVIGEELEAKHLLLSLADMHGIRPEVAQLVKGIGDLRPVNPAARGLGPLLVEARKRSGMTIYQVYGRSGISRSQLAFYENGMQKNPGIRTVQALAYGYRLPFALILLATLMDIRPRAKIRKRNRP